MKDRRFASGVFDDFVRVAATLINSYFTFVSYVANADGAPAPGAVLCHRQAEALDDADISAHPNGH